MTNYVRNCTEKRDVVVETVESQFTFLNLNWFQNSGCVILKVLRSSSYTLSINNLQWTENAPNDVVLNFVYRVFGYIHINLLRSIYLLSAY